MTLVAIVFLTSPSDRVFAQGWNPADMLRRADRNGDGRLDEGEVDDRFKGFLERAANDAGMRGGFPYDVNRMAEAMDRARRERERGRDDDNDRDRDRDRGRDRGRDEASKPEPLVPGFGEKTELPAPLSFGDGSVFLTKEQAQAQYGTRLVSMVDQMMERYDRDKSGALERREWEGGRWSTPPETSDLNKDGILTQSELYMRLKDRFSGNQDENDDNDGDNQNQNGGARPATPPATPAVLTNIPSGAAQGAGGSRFVSRRNENDEDRDDDGDRRPGDGGERRPGGPMTGGSVVGGAPMVGGSPLVGGGPAGATPPRIGTPGGYRRDDSGDESQDEESDEDEADRSEAQANNDRYVRFAETMIRNFDKDKNGTIEKSEWSSMTGDPASADFDRDGKLTKDELVKRLADKYGGGGNSGSGSSTPARTTSSLNSNRSGVSSKDAYAASRSYGEEQGARPAYRFLTPVERLPSGLPDWFLEKDKNADAQVGMYEFASEWTDEEVQKFTKLDKNSNGFISAKEVQAGEGGEVTQEDAGDEDER
jgi:hypothetical protein